MRLQTWWAVGLLGTLLGTAMSPRLDHTARLAVAEASSPAGTIHLNLRNVDIVQMITMMSTLTGRNFLVDEKVRGQVTLMAPTPVTIEEAYQIFLAALAMQGFTVVPQGPISTIVPSRDAKTQALPTLTTPSPAPR